MNKNVKRCLIGLCVLILLTSVGCLTYIEYNRNQEQKAFEELERKRKEQAEIEKKKQEQAKQQQKEEVEQVQEEPEEEELVILPEFEELYEDDSDLYGWIKIDDTIIDYPVMITPQDPNYYNHHSWEKEETVAGTPFADGRTVYNETENTILYAHHMQDRSMFGSLKDYKDITFYENHKYIEFDTIYEKAKYEIISVSKGIVYYEKEPPEGEYLFYEHVELDTEEDFDDYIKNIKDNEYFDTGVTAQYGDKIITLCTCDYWTENARLLVVAKKIS